MTCRICESPYRDEIERLIKKGIAQKEVYTTFAPAFETAPVNLKMSFYKHFKKKHPPLLDPVPQRSYLAERNQIKQEQQARDAQIAPPTQNKVANTNSPEAYAERLLELGFSPELMNSKKVSHKDIVSAQKLLIEKERVKNERDALKISLLKLMAGNIRENETIPGEIISEDDMQQLMGGNSETAI